MEGCTPAMGLTLQHFFINRVKFKGLFGQFGRAAAFGTLGVVMRVGILFDDFNRFGNLFIGQSKGHGAE
jgi:hypothetical protein